MCEIVQYRLLGSFHFTFCYSSGVLSRDRPVVSRGLPLPLQGLQGQLHLLGMCVHIKHEFSGADVFDDVFDDVGPLCIWTKIKKGYPPPPPPPLDIC